MIDEIRAPISDAPRPYHGNTAYRLCPPTSACPPLRPSPEYFICASRACIYAALTHLPLLLNGFTSPARHLSAKMQPHVRSLPHLQPIRADFIMNISLHDEGVRLIMARDIYRALASDRATITAQRDKVYARLYRTPVPTIKHYGQKRYNTARITENFRTLILYF